MLMDTCIFYLKEKAFTDVYGGTRIFFKDAIRLYEGVYGIKFKTNKDDFNFENNLKDELYFHCKIDDLVSKINQKGFAKIEKRKLKKDFSRSKDFYKNSITNHN